MGLTPVPWDAPLEAYERQAATVLAAFHAKDAATIDAVHHAHPRFLDDTVTWLPRPLSREEIATAPFTIDDARLAVARTYSFADWEALAEHVAAVRNTTSPTHRFEAAVQAVVDGRIDDLAHLLTLDAGLVHARSQRRTCHDPSVHGATLLHYLVANGVEGVNQRTPRNAVEVAQLLLAAGADPNATAGLYGGRCSVMSMLVSSSHPNAAGVHVPLVDILVSFGATVEPA
ncbi:MAG: ankyrin repeat domain-containing protein, partial [Gemmatimonadetes bacterium]|nr:ankyrin repeat domain-containing protein [Gemmatimonadota bacterium]